jgi:hypothetical protein
MNADWVAATVRARSLSQRRVGAGGSRRIAAQRTFGEAIALLASTAYADRLEGGTDLAAAERATRDVMLWRLRVLAGWMPATGARLFRTAAGAYERDNIVALAHHLDDGRPAPDPFDLGTLATSWPSLRAATSVGDLADALRRSSWGDAGAGGISALRDALTLVWLRRLADVAPPSRPWVEIGAALTVARIVFVDGTEPSPRIRQLLRPLLGRTWESAGNLVELRAALPRSTESALRDVSGPEDLWRAEAGLWATVEADGFRLLRSSLPGPDVILGAIAVLAVDAWRVRAALAAASLGTGSSEVLDAVA